MKQTINLPLSAMYSLIKKMEEMANNPETVKQYNGFLSTLNMLKESFMPLFEEFKDCINMPDIDVSFDTKKDTENKNIDWEQRRYELTKAAMQGRVSALDKNFNYKAVMPSIARDSVKMAELVIESLRKA